MRRAILLALVMASLGCDFKIALPHGYEIWELEGREVLVVTPNHYMAVAPDVRSYAVIGDLVVGHAEIPARRGARDIGPPPARGAAGYFVLDTASGKVWDPLTKREWLARLRELGIQGEPALKGI